MQVSCDDLGVFLPLIQCSWNRFRSSMDMGIIQWSQTKMNSLVSIRLPDTLLLEWICRTY